MIRRFPLLYPAWIAVCAILFVALRGAEDPSRRHGRVTDDDAAAIAMAALQKTPRYRGYEVVHVTDPGRSEKHYLVLCDRVPHTALRDAVVVEVSASDGRVMLIRKPVD